MSSPEAELALRIEAATALRELSHELVSHAPDMATLTEIRDLALALTKAVAEAPLRTHGLTSSGSFAMPPPRELREEEPRHLFADSIVTGRANPMSIDAQVWKEEGEAVIEVVLGPAFEGAPGRAHGGIVAAIVDEVMGLVLGIVGEPAFTGRLTITYRAATPLGVPLRGRARLVERRGRKLIMSAEITAGDTLIAEGESLFIVVDPAKFVSGAPGGMPGRIRALDQTTPEQ